MQPQTNEPMPLPDFIQNVLELDEILSRPSEPVIETAKPLHGNIMLLGAGGEMGPSLAALAK
jgi:hypothetical protein